MLCKIWGFHGNDYEECRLLGYKNPVRTSQETQYFSATQSSQLMLCKICAFHGSDYEECRLLGHKNPFRTSQETHYISEIWRRVALVRTKVSEKRVASIIRVERMSELGRTLAVTSNWSSSIPSTLMTKAIRSSETSVLTGPRRCHMQKDGILQRQT
jgi:hypothetical protein